MRYKPLWVRLGASYSSFRGLRPWRDFVPGDNRVSAACEEIDKALSDGQWHKRIELAKGVAGKHDLSVETVSELIRRMTRLGDVEATTAPEVAR